MKKRLRNKFKRILDTIPAQEALDKSCAIAEKITRLDEFEAAAVIMIYLTTPGEVDTAPIAEAGWARSRTVVAPKACPNTRRMEAVVCPYGDEDILHPGHGLRRPAHGPTVSASEIDLVIVPALSFDRRCNRLGRGGGFYDRFIAREELAAISLGVCFAEQITDELPMNKNDKPVDIVVTDRDVFRRH